MRKLFSLWALLTAICVSATGTYEELISYLPDNDGIMALSEEEQYPLEVMRVINGGTKFRVSYADDVDYDVRGAFEYACKIVEEYIPTCLPIIVKLEWADMRSSTTPKPLSSVKVNLQETFGWQEETCNTMARIKAITFKEMARGYSITFLDSIPDMLFLDNTMIPDITIRLNREIRDELSFSLDAPESGKYDFVSLAMRDLFRGLGLFSGYRGIPSSQTLLKPSRRLTIYERDVLAGLLSLDDPQRGYILATKGSINIKNNKLNNHRLNLYAPSPFKNDVSLNYFIPDSGYDISRIMSYDVKRGIVNRAISDGYSSEIFRDLLGWRENFTVGIDGSSSVSEKGSTSIFVPYQGSYLYPGTIPSINKYEKSAIPVRRENGESAGPGVLDYCKQFHPFQIPAGYNKSYGTSESLQLKDGTWDLVSFNSSVAPEAMINMSSWVLNHPLEDYERTCDGYLKCRRTIATVDLYTSNVNLNVNYFVADYLPQRVELKESCDNVETLRSSYASGSRPVRVTMKNLEGITRMIVERFVDGNDVPSRFIVNDFKKGFFETTVSTTRKTTFTVIGYNANGSTRGIPIEIAPVEPTTELSARLDGEVILLEGGYGTKGRYEMIPLTSVSAGYADCGIIDRVDRIDISHLPTGMYVLRITCDNGDTLSYRFIKK